MGQILLAYSKALARDLTAICLLSPYLCVSASFTLLICFEFIFLALFGCGSSFCSPTTTPARNPKACLGLGEVLTFSLPLQLLTTLLLHRIKVSDLACDALTRDICLILAWKAARVELGSTTHPCTKAEVSAGWKKLYYFISASKLNSSTKAHTFYDTAYCLH